MDPHGGEYARRGGRSTGRPASSPAGSPASEWDPRGERGRGGEAALPAHAASPGDYRAARESHTPPSGHSAAVDRRLDELAAEMRGLREDNRRLAESLDALRVLEPLAAKIDELTAAIKALSALGAHCARSGGALLWRLWRMMRAKDGKDGGGSGAVCGARGKRGRAIARERISEATRAAHPGVGAAGSHPVPGIHVFEWEMRA